MKTNIGNIERGIRAVGGLVLRAGRRAAGHRPDRLVPALRHAGHQHLQDQERLSPGAP